MAFDLICAGSQENWQPFSLWPFKMNDNIPWNFLSMKGGYSGRKLIPAEDRLTGNVPIAICFSFAGLMLWRLFWTKSD